MIGRPNENDLARYFRINESSNPDFINSILPEKGEFSDFEETLEKMDKTGFLKKGSLAMDLIIGLLKFNVNKRLSADQALKHEFFKELNSEEALNILLKKFQDEIIKNKEFHGEKIIYVKKKDGLKRDKENINKNNEHRYCSELPERKGHIMKKMDGYDIQEDKMEVEQPNQNEHIQNWNSLEDFI